MSTKLAKRIREVINELRRLERWVESGKVPPDGMNYVERCLRLVKPISFEALELHKQKAVDSLSIKQLYELAKRFRVPLYSQYPKPLLVTVIEEMIETHCPGQTPMEILENEETARGIISPFDSFRTDGGSHRRSDDGHRSGEIVGGFDTREFETPDENVLEAEMERPESPAGESRTGPSRDR